MIIQKKYLNLIKKACLGLNSTLKSLTGTLRHTLKNGNHKIKVLKWQLILISDRHQNSVSSSNMYKY